MFFAIRQYHFTDISPAFLRHFSVIPPAGRKSPPIASMPSIPNCIPPQNRKAPGSLLQPGDTVCTYAVFTLTMKPYSSNLVHILPIKPYSVQRHGTCQFLSPLPPSPRRCHCGRGSLLIPPGQRLRRCRYWDSVFLIPPGAPLPLPVTSPPMRIFHPLSSG